MKIERYEIDGVLGFKVWHTRNGRKLFVCVARDSERGGASKNDANRLADAARLWRARAALREALGRPR